MPETNCFADIVQAEAVIKFLQEKISAVVGFPFIFFQKFGGGVAYDDLLLFFIFSAVQLISVFLGPYIRIHTSSFGTDLIQVS